MATIVTLWNPWPRNDTGYREVESRLHDVCVELTDLRNMQVPGSDLAPGDLTVRIDWDTGNRTTGIDEGDRIFCLLVGDYGRGIIRSGIALGPIYHGAAVPGVPWTNFVPVQWDTAVPMDDPLPTDLLMERIPEVNWLKLQGSGCDISQEKFERAASKLERLWTSHVNSRVGVIA